MKTTPFTQYHIAAGARMAEFAGYNMPIEFSGITDEHMAVRNNAGVFDVSHMGEIWVDGPRSLEFLQWVTTNDVSALTPGKAQYSAMPNGKGGLVDDILVYCIRPDEFLLVVNASNIDKDWSHLVSEGARFGISPGSGLRNASDETAQLAVQGPNAMRIVQQLCSAPIEELPYYTFTFTTVAGIPNVLLSATGYTGSGGCEIYVASKDADALWKALWEVGTPAGLKNIGLGARDTLRLEKGFCLYGNDLDDTTSTIEAGLGWITKFSKDFLEKPLFEYQKVNGPSRRLVGFKMSERGIPRHGYSIADPSGAVIGTVTSGTMSPCLKEGIGMGYVDPAFSKPDTEVAVLIRDKPVKAVVVKPPFV